GRWAQLDRDAIDHRDLGALEALEALGGHSAYQADGYVAIVRPGKTAGMSASIGHLGPGVVKIFSSSWSPLRCQQVYDADQLAALAGEQLRDDEGQSAPTGAVAGTASTTPASWTDAHVGEAFGTTLKDRWRYCKALGGWLHWDGRRWALDVSEGV